MNSESLKLITMLSAVISIYLNSLAAIASEWDGFIGNEETNLTCFLSIQPKEVLEISDKNGKSIVNLTILSFGPLKTEFSIQTNLQNRPKITGKILFNDQNIFELAFESNLGWLRKIEEEQALFEKIKNSTSFKVQFEQNKKLTEALFQYNNNYLINQMISLREKCIRSAQHINRKMA